MTIPIACAQIACAVFDPAANRDKADHFIREAARQGARLVVLPEFLTTGCSYEYRIRTFAEPVGGTTTAWLRRRSAQTGCWLAAGMIESADGRVFDTLLLIGPAGEVFAYRKQFPAFFENLYFHRGTTAGIFDTALGRVGVMICWDMVQPIVCQAMEGTIDLLIICSAWPDVRRANIPLYGVRGWLGSQPATRPPHLAKCLNVPVAYCNMSGPFHTPVPWLGLRYRSVYAGRSSINAPGGATVTVAEMEETIILGDVRTGRHARRPEAA